MCKTDNISVNWKVIRYFLISYSSVRKCSYPLFYQLSIYHQEKSIIATDMIEKNKDLSFFGDLTGKAFHHCDVSDVQITKYAHYCILTTEVSMMRI